ncbi:MAG: BolA family protein [Paracoccus sp. (in: a-proteobacteria)]|uniref:BolA family protein n=1 Tax=Paracoccus sp. TaxID=267 RepID=UPI0026E06621|nr:BolA family protein [Paracoccus sp. (in: a-proteobacteria)]MDO5622114.1 BolA family protein [Paracoccus sp. (in: a-proteobacteria)]
MIADEMREKLAGLHATQLDIIDESENHRGHAGWREGGQTHFRIIARSDAFDGLSRVARHRLIHGLLGDLVTRIHALALDLDVPD